MARNDGQLGSYFRQKRISLNISQIELSRALGYESSQFVSNWERGLCNPPFKAIAKLIKILHADVGEVEQLLVAASRKEIDKLLKGVRNRRSR